MSRMFPLSCSAIELFLAPLRTPLSALSLHDARPISALARGVQAQRRATPEVGKEARPGVLAALPCRRSEEHTSELQSLRHLVCRLLLVKIETCSRLRWTRKHAPPISDLNVRQSSRSH